MVALAWRPQKEPANIYKHRVDFATAAKVFNDPDRKIYIDSKHSQTEERFFCIGKVSGMIRIIGAGYWRKGECYYERKDK